MDERFRRSTLTIDDDHWWYRGRRAVLRAELDRLPLSTGARILDAGCGSGRTLRELVRYGSSTGVELSETAIAAARELGGFDVHRGAVEQMPFDDDSFDLITCLDVIEHTPDDIRTLRELRRVLRPGGWLLVTVPAYQWLWSAHDVANHHYRRYNRRMLHEASAQAGWRVIRTTSFNSLTLPGAVLVRIARRAAAAELSLPPRPLNRLLELPLHAEARWLARGRTFPAGLSLLAVMTQSSADR